MAKRVKNGGVNCQSLILQIWDLLYARARVFSNGRHSHLWKFTIKKRLWFGLWIPAMVCRMWSTNFSGLERIWPIDAESESPGREKNKRIKKPKQNRNCLKRTWRFLVILWWTRRGDKKWPCKEMESELLSILPLRRGEYPIVVGIFF